jgi:hypothetical protein
MFSYVHELLTKDAAHEERCEELRTLITEHIKGHLPADKQRTGGQSDRTPAMLVQILPRIRTVDSVEAMELHLAFLQGLRRKIGFFDFQEFIHLTGSKDRSPSLSPLFLYKAYLEIDGFDGAYDVRQGALGLNAYPHLQDLINGDNGEAISMALLKASLVLGSQGYEYGFVTSTSFPLEGDVDHLGYYLKDRTLASMIANNPELVDGIVEVLLTRGAFPGEEPLLEIINSEAKALSAGVL